VRVRECRRAVSACSQEFAVVKTVGTWCGAIRVAGRQLARKKGGWRQTPTRGGCARVESHGRLRARQRAVLCAARARPFFQSVRNERTPTAYIRYARRQYRVTAFSALRGKCVMSHGQATLAERVNARCFVMSVRTCEEKRRVSEARLFENWMVA